MILVLYVWLRAFKSLTIIDKFMDFVVMFCRQIAKHLSLPPVKLHCSMLAEDAIKAAIKNYKEKQDKANGETVETIDSTYLHGIGSWWKIKEWK